MESETVMTFGTDLADLHLWRRDDGSLTITVTSFEPALIEEFSGARPGGTVTAFADTLVIEAAQNMKARRDASPINPWGPALTPIAHMGDATALLASLNVEKIDTRVDDEQLGPMGATTIDVYLSPSGVKFEHHQANGGATLYIVREPER